MTIVENSILHLSTLLFFLLGFGGLILSRIKRSPFIGQIALGAIILGCLQTLFIGIVNGSAFVLSPRVDVSINFVFTFSSTIIAVVALWGIMVYYRHADMPIIITQLGLVFSGLILFVTFYSAISYRINKPVAKRPEAHKFLRAEEFQKGDPNPELSKVKTAQDSLPKQ